MTARCWFSPLFAMASVLVCVAAAGAQSPAAERPGPFRISADGHGFVLSASGKQFTPWGFNYDHDEQGRLLEDYWNVEWKKVEEDFAEMKQLGANVVRVHPQLGKFMLDAEHANPKALEKLAQLLQLAERTGLYLNITGLGCYKRPDVPAWYDKLSEPQRWAVQANFWKSVAHTCQSSSAVFCYDLMNEPVSPAGERKAEDWLGPPLKDRYFVQRISLDRAGRERTEIARLWIHQLVEAIHSQDRRHLITVGLVPWSLDRPGLSSGFVPKEIAGELDFISVHIYPEAGKIQESLDTLAGFDVGKPVVIEEIFPLRCTIKELEEFIDQSKGHTAGWIGFYWGTPPEVLKNSKKFGHQTTLQWLELFRRKGLGTPKP